ncbi:unnamed protein product [Prunus armeniaca]
MYIQRCQTHQEKRNQKKKTPFKFLKNRPPRRARRATARVHPNLWKPRRLELMNNDLPSTNPEDSMSCFDLSKNDTYLMSAFKVTRKLEGHTKRVTLAFSNTLNVLIPDGKELRSLSDTYIQIQQNELHLLAINKTHLAVYEVKELACV